MCYELSMVFWTALLNALFEDMSFTCLQGVYSSVFGFLKYTILATSAGVDQTSFTVGAKV